MPDRRGYPQDLLDRLHEDAALANAALRPVPPEWEFEPLEIVEALPVPPAAVLEALGLEVADEPKGA